MITNKLLKVARAMAEFEGWHYAGHPVAKYPVGSAAYRNHNPGNLRYSVFQVGMRDGFAVFVNDEVGFFAMVYDLWVKASGRSTTGITGSSTIYQMIKVYSPEPPGIALNYALHVESRTGIPMTTKLKELLKD